MSKNKKYHELSNVEKQRNFLVPEEFPEGPYGSALGAEAPVENKSTDWEEGQRYYTAFNWENKSLHEGMPREFPGAHQPHDAPDRDSQSPYDGYGND
ncbi:cytosolic protein [Bacillus massiliglaciei]|uniref:cytosolic protein n=1 Tax=Bacillus massiliglaciei TaxID=1816693 RepID=UPI000AB1091C|nr:cytosolic protein [Bacillus massiliglaciei]